MPLSRERLARNQVIFREVNQRLREMLDAVPSGMGDYLCECSDVGCSETIELDTTEYEAIRSMPNVFLIVPGHERLEVERVLVDDNERFMLVEKTRLVDDVELAAALGERPWPSHGP